MRHALPLVVALVSAAPAVRAQDAAGAADVFGRGIVRVTPMWAGYLVRR
jgi:hypothetical protein